MNFQVYTHAPPTFGSALAPTAEEAMTSFELNLKTCCDAFSNGDDTLMLNDDLHSLFGELGLQFFEQSLAKEIGASVSLTLVESSHRQQTCVQMQRPLPVQQPAQEQQSANASHTSHSSQVSTTTSACPKKAPRPMNCWIIFRDAMHKKLKAENPDLSVQKICKYPH